MLSLWWKSYVEIVVCSHLEESVKPRAVMMLLTLTGNLHNTTHLHVFADGDMSVGQRRLAAPITDLLFAQV